MPDHLHAFSVVLAGSLLMLAGLCAPASGQPAPAAPTTIAHVIATQETNIGHLIRLPDVVSIDNKSISFAPTNRTGLTVLAMTSATCPISRRYAPRLAALEREYAAKGVKFVFVNPGKADSPEEAREHAKASGFQGAYIADQDRTLSDALGATTTAEVFILDSARTLRYRGAVDDQYSLGASQDSPRHTFLVDALAAILAGKVPVVSATSAPGCVLEPGAKQTSSPAPTPAPSLADAKPTYWADISRIVQNNCVECHRPGGVGPFSLTSYTAVSSRASTIAFVVNAGQMPPWFAAAPKDPHPHTPAGAHSLSPFANDRSLSASDKATLLAWLKGDKAEGNKEDAPVPLTWPEDEWTIGTPDAIIQIPDAQAIKAEGVMPYIHVRVPTHFGADKWVRGLEVLPTSRATVHHVLVFVMPAASEEEGWKPGDRARRAREAFDESQGFFAAYVPGKGGTLYPEGFAKKLPKNATLVFQLHYTPNGTATTDQTKLGLVFTDKAPEHVLRVHGIANHKISIPPNDPAHRESAALTLKDDVRILTLMPHMHLRGKAFTYEAHPPGANDETFTLLDVPHYDFNWQIRYQFREPPLLKAGTIVDVTAVYDNSAANAANPDPTATVRWGQQTFNEMMLGYVEYYLEHENHRDLDRTGEQGAAGVPAGASGNDAAAEKKH